MLIPGLINIKPGFLFIMILLIPKIKKLRLNIWRSGGGQVALWRVRYTLSLYANSKRKSEFLFPSVPLSEYSKEL